jgi:hypothetical protein
MMMRQKDSEHRNRSCGSVGALPQTGAMGLDASDCFVQRTLENECSSKQVAAGFDVGHVSSDGGAILLKGLERPCRRSENLPGCLGGRR